MKWQSDHNTLMRSAREEGLAEGLEKGIEKGVEQGIARGKTEAARETARAMLKENDPVEKIARVLGLSIEEIEKLREG